MKKRFAIGAGVVGTLLAAVLGFFLFQTPPAEPLDINSIVGSGDTSQAFVRLLQVKKTLLVNAGKRILGWTTDSDAGAIDAANPKGESKKLPRD